MTEKQRQQFNLMRGMLIRISKHYMTPDQMRRQHDRDKGMGPSYEEEVEMAYENIQFDAARAVKGIKEIKAPTPSKDKAKADNE